jgi:predicted nucleic acid-binding protein
VIVVSDTSPLTYLHQIERLSILADRYGPIVIPPAVKRELEEAGSIHKTFDWSLIQVVSPREPPTVGNRVKLPLIQCAHEARSGEEMTPERVAKVLLEEKSETRRGAQR